MWSLTTPEMFATFVREPTYSYSTSVPKSTQQPNTSATSTQQFGTTGNQPLPYSITQPTTYQTLPAVNYAQQVSSTYKSPTIFGTAPLQSLIVYPSLSRFDTPQLSPFKTRVYNSQAFCQRFQRQPQIPYTATQVPQFANQLPPIVLPEQVPIIKQPRYPPLGSYLQTVPHKNRICWITPKILNLFTVFLKLVYCSHLWTFLKCLLMIVSEFSQFFSKFN